MTRGTDRAQFFLAAFAVLVAALGLGLLGSVKDWGDNAYLGQALGGVALLAIAADLFLVSLLLSWSVARALVVGVIALVPLYVVALSAVASLN